MQLFYTLFGVLFGLVLFALMYGYIRYSWERELCELIRNVFVTDDAAGRLVVHDVDELRCKLRVVGLRTNCRLLKSMYNSLNRVKMKVNDLWLP